MGDGYVIDAVEDSVGTELEHSWSDWTPDGDTNHKHTCTVCRAEGTEEHSWGDPVVTKEVTDRENGEMEYECTACGAKKTEAVPALAENEEMLTLKDTVNKDGEELNCIVQDPYKVLPDGVRLEIKLAEGERYDELKVQLDDTHPIENVAFFDINLYDLNDNKLPMPLDRKVRVLLQIPEGWDKADMEAVLIAADKDLEFEESIVTIDGVNYVAFWTDHFSPYAEIDKLTPEEAAALKAKAEAEGKKVDSEGKFGALKTGETTDLYLMLGLALVAALVISLISLRRKKELLLDEK